jgi:hypothetical protein
MAAISSSNNANGINATLTLSSSTLVQQYDTTNPSLSASSLPIDSRHESSHNSCSRDCCGHHLSNDLFLPRGGGGDDNTNVFDGSNSQGQQQSHTSLWDNNESNNNDVVEEGLEANYNEYMRLYLLHQHSANDKAQMKALKGDFIKYGKLLRKAVRDAQDREASTPQPSSSSTDARMADPTEDNDNAIKVDISHSLEEGCNTCGIRLERDEVKIVDPMLTEYDLWIHLHCWEVKNPQIVQLFAGNNNNNNRIIRAFSQAIEGGLLQGWHQLQCNQRYQVLSHIFYKNQSVTLTARDIITHFKCGKSGCSYCQHPNDCSYHSIQKCIHPELPLIKCRNNSCDNVMHDGCVIGFQSSFGLEEQGPFVCLSCHPRKLSSTQRRIDQERQASFTERSNNVSSTTRAASRTRTRFQNNDTSRRARSQVNSDTTSTSRPATRSQTNRQRPPTRPTTRPTTRSQTNSLPRPTTRSQSNPTSTTTAELRARALSSTRVHENLNAFCEYHL